MMNKRGVAFLGIMFALMYFMIGMIAYQFIKPDIAIQRDAEHMKCSAPDTSGDKVVCLIIGSVIPMLIISILSVAGGIATEKVFP